MRRFIDRDMKQCTKCLEDLPLECFGNRSASSDGKQARCKRCMLDYNTTYKRTDAAKATHNARNRRKSRAIKKWLLESLGVSKCETEGCLEDHPACLDFHHKDRSDKEFRIAGSYNTRRRDLLLEEARKCQVLCANCHRKLHYRED